jgi:hypothetical protein
MKDETGRAHGIWYTAHVYKILTNKSYWKRSLVTTGIERVISDRLLSCSTKLYQLQWLFIIELHEYMITLVKHERIREEVFTACLKVYCAIHFNGLKKPMKTSIRLVNILAIIWTKHFLNRSQTHYHWANLLGQEYKYYSQRTRV